MIDALEARRIFSATIANTVLTITGTGGNDVCNVSLNASGRVLVVLNGVSRSFARVSRIEGSFDRGNDSISISNGVRINALLRGGLGNDTLNGGSGNDRLFGDRGADVMSGGAGIDLVDYSTRTASVFIGMDDFVNDGEAGENDDVRSDIENARGGSGNDVMSGTEGVNDLRGGAGADAIRGFGGSDFLGGGFGNDTIECGSGNDAATGDGGIDSVNGGTGDDTLEGGDGNDTMNGDDGKDRLDGGAGDDSLIAGNGASSLLGGAGNDVLDANNDTVDDRCIGGEGDFDGAFLNITYIRGNVAGRDKADIELQQLIEI